ncbi:Cysteine desulfurase family protein [[Clostridium] ultunense Esp]|uniref:cysteine desulfurase n=1 Tax=[Clostridium] ultunense Esp TaxID=1288971 RepID=M1ZH61_9FIRM|nr:aminotransferase class V-fold PLP-dependent enzyme [Schnuerera ultunensis]CCQ97819.1 Cysteine desulfurase family protein [[Clostridium] ultunense Esp]SHD77619.1 Cysteine desulfurase family protein [[Clostridium] ultunense Esp]
MRGLYLDNGATAFPKAPGVVESMSNYLLNIGCNVNRGAYKSSFEAENIVYETRELICELFNYQKTENVVFTKNITESLNVLIKGLIKVGDHVVVSSMEHNAVIRPLNSLAKLGIEFSKVPCNKLGELNPEDINKYIKPNTKAVIMTHASNVCGTILDLKRVGSICKEKGLYFIIDTAQTAGFLDIHYKDIGADAIAFTGHKGLLGPQGIGGFIVSKEMASTLDTLIEGGTGSLSDKEVQPEYMPDKFEAGTLNIPGVYGLNASIKYILKEKVSTIREKELYLLDHFLEGILNIPGLDIIGKKDIKDRTAVISIDIPEEDNAVVSYNLYNEFGIMTRCGLHCAPSAHQTLGTFPKGTIRFSFSHFNTIGDVNYVIDAINKVIKN